MEPIVSPVCSGEVIGGGIPADVMLANTGYEDEEKDTEILAMRMYRSEAE